MTITAWRRMRTCTRKVRHRDELAAQSAAYTIMLIPGRPVCRFYQCKYCNGYHLTSQR